MFLRSRLGYRAPISSQTSLGQANMPFKPNYNYQRAERDRAKKAAKEAKLLERKEQAALRKTNEAAEAEPGDDKAQGPEE